MELQANFWYDQRMFEKSKFEVSHAADVYEKLGAERDLGRCRKHLQELGEQINNPAVSDESDANRELPETLPLPACTNGQV